MLTKTCPRKHIKFAPLISIPVKKFISHRIDHLFIIYGLNLSFLCKEFSIEGPLLRLSQSFYQCDLKKRTFDCLKTKINRKFGWLFVENGSFEIYTKILTISFSLWLCAVDWMNEISEYSNSFQHFKYKRDETLANSRLWIYICMCVCV